MLVPLSVGLILGGVITLTLQFSGMARERSSVAVTLVAIAAFYPVFAAANGELNSLIFHTAVMALFIACAWFGFRHSATFIAFGLVAHGLFDVSMLFFTSPAPIWWPTFCAAVDIVLGLWLFWRTRQASMI